MILVEGVTKRFGVYTALDDVTFAAEPGRVTGFLGPNGAGKFTTMRSPSALPGPRPARHTSWAAASPTCPTRA